MNNDPELSGKYLGTITRDFVNVADTLKEASYQIRKRGFSDFPIFPISKTAISVGTYLFGQLDKQVEWNYYASYLDEFIQRKLVSEEGIEAFEQNFKNPDEFCCLFVVEPDFTNFVFIPYPDEE